MRASRSIGLSRRPRHRHRARDAHRLVQPAPAGVERAAVESRSATASRAAQRLRHGFVVAQIALAFVLLSGAGLLALSLGNVMALSPGFAAERTFSGHMSLPGSSYPNGASILSFAERLVRTLGATPGVRSVGFATNVPLSGNDIKSAARVKGHSFAPGESLQGHYSYGVDGDYFRAMGLPLEEGRYLTAADARSPTRVCVVDGTSRGATGRTVAHSASGSSREAKSGPMRRHLPWSASSRSVKQADLTEEVAQGAVYYPLGQRLDSELFIVSAQVFRQIRLAPPLQQMVRQLDRDLPVTDILSMDTRISRESRRARRSPALLAAIFSEPRRAADRDRHVWRPELCRLAAPPRNRAAHGARRGTGPGAPPVPARCLAATCGGCRARSRRRLGGRPRTPESAVSCSAVHIATLAGTLAVMTTVSLIACLLPAHRAARISPMAALAEE